MPPRTRRLAGTDAALLAATIALLWAVGRPAPSAALNQVEHAPADAGLVALVGLAAWLCAGWLAVVVLAAHLSLLPGATGRAAAALARLVTPAATRRLLEVALGVSLAGGVLGPAPALADAAAPRPTAVSAPVAPSLDWPLPPAPAAATVALVAARPATHRAVDGTVVVRRGDTLWDIAARHLGPGASAAEIAADWPRWFAANRALIGTDPDLILPGQRLTPPPPAG